MHRTSSRVLLIVAAFVLFLVPVAAIAAGGFTDVDDGNVFKADIQWLADAGVTKGCNPPTNTEFCPGSNVTREQMAAFMHRLAVNKVVNAKTAMDADKLDGKDSAAFAASGHNHNAAYLAKTGKAADANELDGIDSHGFLPDGTPPVGMTERGNYAFGSDSRWGWDNIEWGFEMPAPPVPHFISVGEVAPAECPGTPADPQAVEGHLCVYERVGSAVYLHNVGSGGTSDVGVTDTFGAFAYAWNTGTGDFYSYGTWAITVGTAVTGTSLTRGPSVP